LLKRPKLIHSDTVVNNLLNRLRIGSQ
jgi:hypothetical protein